MKKIRVFLSEKFHFLVVNILVYLNRRVFVMEVLQYFSCQQHKTLLTASCKAVQNLDSLCNVHAG